MPVKCNPALNKAALPYLNRFEQVNLPIPGHCVNPVSDVTIRLSAKTRNSVFLNCAHPYACSGREKGACDRLQRHPLIYPIFSRLPGISAPFARGNLHLVTLSLQGPAADSPLSIVNRCSINYTKQIVHGQGRDVKHNVPKQDKWAIDLHF